MAILLAVNKPESIIAYIGFSVNEKFMKKMLDRYTGILYNGLIRGKQGRRRFPKTITFY